MGDGEKCDDDVSLLRDDKILTGYKILASMTYT